MLIMQFFSFVKLISLKYWIINLSYIKRITRDFSFWAAPFFILIHSISALFVDTHWYWACWAASRLAPGLVNVVTLCRGTVIVWWMWSHCAEALSSSDECGHTVQRHGHLLVNVVTLCRGTVIFWWMWSHYAEALSSSGECGHTVQRHCHLVTMWSHCAEAWSSSGECGHTVQRHRHLLVNVVILCRGTVIFWWMWSQCAEAPSSSVTMWSHCAEAQSSSGECGHTVLQRHCHRLVNVVTLCRGTVILLPCGHTVQRHGHLLLNVVTLQRHCHLLLNVVILCRGTVIFCWMWSHCVEALSFSVTIWSHCAEALSSSGECGHTVQRHCHLLLPWSQLDL